MFQLGAVLQVNLKEPLRANKLNFNLRGNTQLLPGVGMFIFQNGFLIGARICPHCQEHGSQKVLARRSSHIFYTFGKGFPC